MPDVFVSTDIETDGPIPAQNSMLSFGSVAFAEDGTECGEFSRNLEFLPGATSNPDTMSWWGKNSEAFLACRKDPVDPSKAIHEYLTWVDSLPGTPVFVAYPAGFDFLFMYWYMIRFAGRSPFGFSALDIKTYASAVLKKPYRKSTKRAMPARWFPPEAPHTHVAVEDAREQGLLFLAMRKEHLGL